MSFNKTEHPLWHHYTADGAVPIKNHSWINLEIFKTHIYLILNISTSSQQIFSCCGLIATPITHWSVYEFRKSSSSKILLTASSCFFFWTKSSNIRLTFARSKFSWSGLRISWKTCHRGQFWGPEATIGKEKSDISEAVRIKLTKIKALYSQDDLTLVFFPQTFVSV